jgi:hypothetical protein
VSRAARWGARALCGAAIALVAGCSQVSALAPVGGDDITTLRIAIDDMLSAQQVPVLVSPKCVAEGDAFACTGSTKDGSPIVATSPPGEPRTMSVTVGAEVIYEGEVQSVVEKAAEADS